MNLGDELEQAFHRCWSSQREGKDHAYNKKAFQEFQATVTKASDALRKLEVAPQGNVRKAAMGAQVIFCGHSMVFVADIFHIGKICIVKANGPISKNATRYKTEAELYRHATHHVLDFPGPNVWMPERGVLVVPEGQVRVKGKDGVFRN